MKIWENFKNKIDKYKFKNLFLSMFVFCILVLTIFPTIAYAQILSVDGVVSSVSKFIAEILLKISSAFLGLAGSIFDYIVRTTILEMGDKMSNQEGLGGSISSAWLTLRDIANMCFIFVLLFTAFKAMFSLNFGNTGRTILNIVLVALLINFSLFFTKVVIDASNIVSEGFYNSIVSYGANPPQNEGQTNTGTQKSITGGYMRMVNINSWYDVNGNLEAVSDAGKVLVTGFMGSMFFLITAVVFMISAFMFLARFLILIFLMILSPVAFIAIIVPGMSSHFEKWKSAVIDQSIFAPVFFALTWIVFKLGTTEGFLTRGSVFTDLTTGPPTKDSMALVFNFLIIIGMAIMALIVSKQIATRTAGFTAITGGIAAGAIGGGAMIGRQTIGRGANLAFKSSTLRNMATEGKYGSKYLARAGLWTAKQGAEGSFDARAIDTLKKVPGLGKEIDILGKAGGKGGFIKGIEEKAKAKAAYAKAVYGQTEEEKEVLDKLKKSEEEDILDENGNVVREGIRNRRIRVARETKEQADTAEQRRKDFMRNELQDLQNNYNNIKKRKDEAQRRGASKEEINSIVSEMTNQRALIDEKRKDVEENNESYKELKRIDTERRASAQEAEKQRKKKDIDEEEYSTKTQQMGKVGQKRQESYAERIRGGSPVSVSGGAMIGGIAGGLAGPIGVAVGASLGAALGNVVGSKFSDKFNWAGNKAAAREIVKQAKGKTKAEKLADAAKDYQKEQDTNTTTENTNQQPTENPQAPTNNT